MTLSFVLCAAFDLNYLGQGFLQVTTGLPAEAEAAGYKGLCFTVDVPVLSNREDDKRNK